MDKNRELITVITRLKTINVGNEALSSEFILLMKNKFSNYKVCPLERAPRFLDRYYYGMLSKDLSIALKQFEEWAQSIAKKVSLISSLTSDINVSSAVTLVRENKTPSWKPLIEKKLHLRAWKSRLGLYDDEMIKRLIIYQSSVLTILNPAGEFNPQSIDPPLRMLLELRVAQILGSKVGIINFSYEISNDIHISSFFANVMNKFDFIRVRDRLSYQELISKGLNENKVNIVTDLAFLTKPDSQEVSTKLAKKYDIKPKTAGLVINSKTSTAKLEDWVQVCLILKEKFSEVILISNELSSDFPFFQTLSQRAEVKVITDQFSYKQYSALLRNLEIVVSTRLHTTILSLVAGTPVIPVEPITRKLKGLVQDMNYSVPVYSVSETNWRENVIQQINSFPFEQFSEEKLDLLVRKQKEQILESFTFLNTIV